MKNHAQVGLQSGHALCQLKMCWCPELKMVWLAEAQECEKASLWNQDPAPSSTASDDKAGAHLLDVMPILVLSSAFAIAFSTVSVTRVCSAPHSCWSTLARRAPCEQMGHLPVARSNHVHVSHVA